MCANNLFENHGSQVGPTRSWTDAELSGLIGSPFASIQKFLVENLPINLLPVLLQHSNTREYVRKLIFDKLPFKMIPIGFRTQYKQWLVEKIVNS